jgi:ABC-type multidrug transport system ATPase subunit
MLGTTLSLPKRSKGLSDDFDSVRLTDVSRHFGRRRALSRLSLSVRAGEVLGLLGPNGRKSTLLGMLATLVTPNTGEVIYGDRSAERWGRRCAGTSVCSRTSCTSTPS